MTLNLKPLMISGKEVLPLIEGGKGVAISTGESSGAWAAAGGVGTFSAVNADPIDEHGNVVRQVYQGRNRKERFKELVDFAIAGGISQAKIAHDVSGGQGRLHMNVLWEMGGAEAVLEGVMEGAKGLIHGITCGAGMPFRLAALAAKHGVHYYPIISSARAFRALWKRSYHKTPDLLGGVVYEDPWLAGGHNGLSNTENPDKPENPYPRVAQLRRVMNDFGLQHVPIIMAGGVWYLRDWTDWMDNPDLGLISFQFGTRPMLTQESPISDAWKKELMTLKEGDVFLNHFSPTGFYSSAVNNSFIKNLRDRSERQVAFVEHATGDHSEAFIYGVRDRTVFLTPHDKAHAQAWIEAGFSKVRLTPESTLIFVTEEEAADIRQNQMDCMGCLSQCSFSNWAANEKGTTGRRADPRSFCIQKSLQEIAHGANPATHLMFAGHAAYKFGQDPFYANGFVPTMKELVARIQTGD
ncbi:MAG: nitronate monooxygenase [Mariprofundaceae bacterium]|nr:nitronate monooxygenase [Mariprofundaceae bacterium]